MTTRITRRKLISASVASLSFAAFDRFTGPANAASGPLGKLYLAGATRTYSVSDEAILERTLAEQGHDLLMCQAWTFVFGSEQAANRAYPVLDQYFLVKTSNLVILLDMEDFPGVDPGLGDPSVSWYYRNISVNQDVSYMSHLHWQHGNIIHVMEGMSLQDSIVEETAKLGQVANSLQFQNRPITVGADGIYSGGAFDVLPAEGSFSGDMAIIPEYEQDLPLSEIERMLREMGVSVASE